MPTIASKPENGLSIEYHIETQTQYQLGKPITVKGIIRNSGASALWILRWNTFLQPHCGDCLLVTHNGSPVPYIGLRVLYGSPSAESYIRIPAGGSEERQIDISEIYDIREPGEYQVSFRLPVLGAAEEKDAEAPRDPGRLKLTIIESEKVAFRIEGSGSGLPIPKVEAPSPSPQTTLGDYRNPRFTITPAWSQQEKNDWADAHRAAYIGILAALKEAEADGLPGGSYRTWIESMEHPGWEGRKETVIGYLTKMADKMSKEDISYNKAEAPAGSTDLFHDPIAWVGGSSPPNTINLTAKAFSNFSLFFAGKADDYAWTRAFVVAHEISHLAASTKDEFYLWFVCNFLAAFYPDIPVRNAQSYALYVMHLDPSTVPYEPEGTVDLKGGDTITLQANNGKFLGNNYLYSYGNFIEAIYDNPEPVNCYFRVNKWDSDFYLIRLSSMNYLQVDGKSYISLGETSRRGEYGFKIGEVVYHDNETYIVLKSVKTGKLLAQCGDYWTSIMANHDNIDQWTFFRVRKVPPVAKV